MLWILDSISDALPFGRLWYGRGEDAIGYAKFYSRSHAAVPTRDNHGERMLSASATERALASFITSDGTQIGERSGLDWWFSLALCSSHTLAGCSSRNREPSLANAGHRRRCTYVILPSTSLQTFRRPNFVCRDAAQISNKS